MISKEDFVQWRNQGVTQEYKAILLDAINDCGNEILSREVPNLDRDQFLRGLIKGLALAIEWEPEFKKEEPVDNQEEQ